MRSALSLLCFLIVFTGLAQNYNRPVPTDVFPYEFQGNTSGNGYFFGSLAKFSVQPGNPNWVSPYPAIFDMNGYMVWYAKPNILSCTDFKYHSGADVFSHASFSQGGVHFYLLDGNLNNLDTLHVQNHEEDIHDIQRAENGNWLLGTRFMDTMDLTGYTFAGNPGSANTIVRGFGVQEIDAGGNIVFEWNSNDHIHPSQTYDFYGYNVSDFDYCHGNAIEEDTDGHLLFSMRHLNAVYKVHRTTGAILWQLGGQASDFTFVNDDGFSAQHDIRRLPNGNYTVYDNANMAPPPRKSRGVEYLLDTTNWTATKVYEYIHPDENFHPAMGSFSTLNDGRRLLGWGFTNFPKPSASFVDEQAIILSEFFFEDSVISYRFLYDSVCVIPRPDISCMENGNGFYLVSPLSASYKWSTGETTQSIPITAPGTYQVWVPYGDGFVGSFPFIVSDVNDPCGLANLSEIGALNHGSYTLYDFLGRVVEFPESNTVYLKVWENGQVERTFLLAE